MKRPFMFRWCPFKAGLLILFHLWIRGHFTAGWLMARPWLEEAIHHK